MKTTDTRELLRAYAEERSETAFQELVNRYVDLVYSVALRRVDGDTLLAEDVAQEVFTDLARKAASLPGTVMLGGWLHRHTGFVASTAMRGEQRRRERERQAVVMNALAESSDGDWNQLAPVLDGAMDELDPADRNALVLRFFESRDLRAVGAALGISDDAAQKRVSRAVERLRDLLVKRRGNMLPIAALSVLLGARCVQAAPAGLGARVGKAAFQAAAAAGGAGLVAGFVQLATSGAAKLVVGTVAVVAIAGALVLYAVHVGTRPVQPRLAQALPATTNPAMSVTNLEPQRTTGAPPVMAKSGDAPDSNALHLVILAADSGKTVPNVQIDYRGWQRKKFKGRTLFANRDGVCAVSIPRESITDLELTTRSDGFADTRLHWMPERGDTIPATYTLRLTRPVAIGGSVVDADGRPVAGAKVGFNHEDDPVDTTLPESHEFSWIEVPTDDTGHWSINRIAPEMLRRIYGSAKHPEHVESVLVFASRGSEVEKQLRAGTYTFHLSRAVTVRGIVLGAEGESVANAKILVGMRGMSDSRQAKSGPDGTFEVKGCRPGTNLLSAEAGGYSAATLQVELSVDSEPFRLTLQRGRVVRLRVTNADGQPIPKATIWLDTMRQRPVNAPDYGVPTVQAEFSRTTDARGCMLWSNAPETELEFDIAATGYTRKNQVKVSPDGQEHVIALTTAPVISGSVRDADTGELISRFRVITGWPQTNWVADPANPGQVVSTVQGQWSTIGRFWANFTGGNYQLTLEEAAVYGMPNPGYILKFEADSYSPFVSRLIGPEETTVQMDVTLRRANAAQVSVVLPDGTPAASADIGLVAPGAQLRLSPGGFSRDSGNGSTAVRHTDGEGHVRLQEDPAVTMVVAAHPAGYAATTFAALAENPVLALQPWGRLEGNYRSGDQPVTGRELLLQYAQREGAGIGFDSITFKVATDAQGHFVFPKAPPGRFKIIRLVHIPPDGFMEQPVLNSEVEIRPGETTTKSLGGDGYTVRAHARWPDDIKPGKNWNFFAELSSAPPQAVLDARNNPAALAQLADSPEMREQIQAYARNAVQLQAEVADDYTITVENVPPGDYVLSAHAFPISQREPNISLSAVSSTLKIPAEPANGSLDAGEILLRKPNLSTSK